MEALASNKLLILNNNILQLNNEFLYTTGSSSTGVYIISKGKRENRTDRFLSVIDSIMIEERRHELYKYVTNDLPVEHVNTTLGIHAIYTPLYNLLTILASTDRNKVILNRLTNKTDNINTLWERHYKLKFLADEVVKYAKLVTVLKSLINKGLKYNKINPALVLSSHNHKVMSLYYMDDGKTIINPFNWLTLIKNTKLYELVFNERDVSKVTSFDTPLVFKAYTHRDTVVSLLGTCYDILQLCNIKLNLTMEDSDLIMLIGGLALTEMGATTENKMLPLTGSIQYVFNTDVEGNMYLRHEQIGKSTIQEIEGDTVVSRTLMQVFLNRVFGADEFMKYVTQFERGRLI